jgi:hypothetical protein
MVLRVNAETVEDLTREVGNGEARRGRLLNVDFVCGLLCRGARDFDYGFIH